MQENAKVLLPTFKARVDSIQRIQDNITKSLLERQKADELYWSSPEGKALIAKRANEKAECEKHKQNNQYPPGTLLKIPTLVGSGYTLITGDYDCNVKGYKIIQQYYLGKIKKIDRYDVRYDWVKAEKLLKDFIVPGKYDLCSNCRGWGTMGVTVKTDVGGNSGYTDLGNGWAVKNPETKWVYDILQTCTHCNGKGFMLIK